MDIARLVQVLDPNAIQSTAELAWLFERLEQIKPQTVLEIGTWRGGIAALAAATGAEVWTVDLQPEMPFAWDDPRYRALVPAPRIHLIVGDAHADSVYTQTAGRQYDVVLIDGNHSHESAGQDFALYAPLGHWVGMHDIVNVHQGASHFWPIWAWPRIKATGARTEEIVSGIAEGGWGLVCVEPRLFEQFDPVMK